MTKVYGDVEKIPKHDQLNIDLWNWERDKEAGMEALGKARNSSFWDWDGGSFPFFWRWQPEILTDVRDGTKLWIQDDLPRHTNFKRKMPKDEKVIQKIVEKYGK